MSGRRRGFNHVISVLSCLKKGFAEVKSKLDEAVNVLNEINTTTIKTYESIEALRHEMKGCKGMPQHLQKTSTEENGFKAQVKGSEDGITVEREMTFRERLTFVGKGANTARVVVDQLQRLKKLPLPIDKDLLVYVSVALNLVTEGSIQEVSYAAANYLAGKVPQMESRIALGKFLEKKSSLTTTAVKMVQTFWPFGVMMIYVKLQTIGANTCVDDIALSSGCPFWEGCYLAGSVSIKKSTEACKSCGTLQRPQDQGLLSLLEVPLMYPAKTLGPSATSKTGTCGGVSQGPREGCHCGGGEK